MNSEGYGKAVLSSSLPATLPSGFLSSPLDSSYWSIRGSEQIQIQNYRNLNISGNAINGIGPNNRQLQKYMDLGSRLGF